MKKYLTPVIALLLISSVAACGVKSSPLAPDGSMFPRKYPAEQKKSEMTPDLLSGLVMKNTG